MDEEHRDFIAKMKKRYSWKIAESKSWEDSVILYHSMTDEERANDGWCGYCGCEGGCNLCRPESLKIALEMKQNKYERV